MKRTVFIILLTMVSVAAWGTKRLPSWMNELPKAGNSTIMYVREAGEGSTLTEAVNQAMLRVLQSTANRIGRQFDIQAVDEALAGGSDYQTLSRQYSIPINKVDQCERKLRDGTYRVWVLCQVATSGNVQPQWEELKGTGDDRPGIALVKSMFVPGLGQIGKGHVAEGTITMVGDVALIGGAVGCYYMAKDKLNVMRDPQVTYDDFTAAQKSYNTLRTTSYILWGAAAGVYVFNLVRAVTAKPRRTDMLTVAPSVMPTEDGFTPSLSLTFNF